jgi:hypothetical protein
MNEWRFDLTKPSPGSAREKLSYLFVGCPGWPAACASRHAENYLGVLGLGGSLLVATGCLELFALALGPQEPKMQAAAGCGARIDITAVLEAMQGSTNEVTPMGKTYIAVMRTCDNSHRYCKEKRMSSQSGLKF